MTCPGQGLLTTPHPEKQCISRAKLPTIDYYTRPVSEMRSGQVGK